MGIAKWRLSNLKSSNESKKQTIISISDPTDDMELAYAHVRYQKSFDREENELKQQQYSQMKEERQQRRKPLASLEIKKFSMQYEKKKKSVYGKMHEERLNKERRKEPYVAPSYSKIGVECLQEEEKLKQLEESKAIERKDAVRKRENYWLLVRDLHAPQISESK